MLRIGFIGLGIMGRGMVKNLVQKGWPVTVWNRSSQRIDELEALLGVTLPRAANPKALAENTDVLLSCVSDPRAVERVMFEPDGVVAGARSGFCHVETSTVSPELVRRIARELERRNARALEAPVTGSRLGAESGTLLFMTGGPKELHVELEPLLLAMGKKVIWCGPSGQGAMAKLAGNTIISYMLEGLAEAMVVAEKAGVSPETLLEVIANSGYASGFFAWKGALMHQRDFDTHFSVDLLVKDQSLMLEQAAALKAPMPGLAAIREVFQAARGLGLGERDVASVIEALRMGAKTRD